MKRLQYSPRDLSKIRIVEGAWEYRIYVPYSLRNLAKEVGGYKWDTAGKYWKYPKNTSNYLKIRQVFKGLAKSLPKPPELEISDKTAAEIGILLKVGSDVACQNPKSKHCGQVGKVAKIGLRPNGTVYCLIRFPNKVTTGFSPGSLEEVFLEEKNNEEPTQLSLDFNATIAPVENNKSAIITLDNVEQELIAYFAKHPEKLTEIHPGEFERLVAAIYRNHGFDVELLGNWNQADGGVDIIAVQKSFGYGDIRLAIQCKCSKNHVSATPIRQLQGVLDRFKAHKGVLCTTSYFSAAAIEETQKWFWRVGLEDRDVIYDRMQNALGMF